MKLEGYASLLRDRKVIADTLTRCKAPKPNSAQLYHWEAGQTRRAVDGIHPQHIRWRVEQVREETPTARTLVLTPLAGPVPAFLPGQYLNVLVDIDGVSTSRPQSISSSPTQLGSLELTVRAKAHGFVSRYLVRELHAGDELTTSGPEGDFSFNPARDRAQMLLIAGGSGITPFMAMAEYLLARHPTTRIALLYGSYAADDMIFKERIERLARTHGPRFSPTFVVSGPAAGWLGERGFIDRDFIARHAPEVALAETSVFLCGPRPMQDSVLRALAALGVVRGKVQVEASGFADDPSDLEGWPRDLGTSTVFSAELAGRSEPIAAQAGELLLSSLERAGVKVPALCRSGVCGSCRSKLTRGRVFTDPSVQRRPSDRSAGYILLCSSYPLSDVALTSH
jgi:glycine betaine catabolism B